MIEEKKSISECSQPCGNTEVINKKSGVFAIHDVRIVV